MFKTLTPILSIIVAIAIFFFFTRPLFDEIKVIQEETNKYKEAVEKASEFNQLLNSLLAKRNSFGARELERLEALVPDSVDEIKIIIDLEKIAEAHEMELSNINVSLGDAVLEDIDAVGGAEINSGGDRLNITADDFETSEVSFNVEGSYEQLKDFVTDLERSLVQMEVVNLAFKTVEGGFDPEYSFTLRSVALKSQI